MSDYSEETNSSIEAIKALDSPDTVSMAVFELFDLIDMLFKADQFQEVDRVIETFNQELDKLSTTLVVAVLASSRPGKFKLTKRKQLFSNAYKLFSGKFPKKRVESLLVGLE